MKFVVGENGRNPQKNLHRPRFVHHETHMGVTETRTRDPSGWRRAPNRLRHEAAILRIRGIIWRLSEKGNLDTYSTSASQNSMRNMAKERRASNPGKFGRTALLVP